MAKPTFYPDWAVQDVNLPATGKTNKVRPREQIRNIGWDKGQIPTAEELNWTLNNQGLWIRYLADEVVASLPGTYLPKNGTVINLSGDLQGTITFNGSNVANASINVLDNSHGHLSSNITDATAQPTPNTVVKRDGRAAAIFGDVVSRSSDSTDTPCYFFQNFSGQNIAAMETSLSGPMFFNRINPSNGAILSTLAINTDGSVSFTLPRSSSGQEGRADSLVRFDYLGTQVTNLQNNFNQQLNSLQTNLTNFINSKSTFYFPSTGGFVHVDNNTGFITQGGNFQTTTTAVQSWNFPVAFPNACLSIAGNVGTSVSNVSGLLLQVENRVSFTSKAVGSGLGCQWIAVGY